MKKMMVNDVVDGVTGGYKNPKFIPRVGECIRRSGHPRRKVVGVTYDYDNDIVVVTTMVQEG